MTIDDVTGEIAVHVGAGYVEVRSSQGQVCLDTGTGWNQSRDSDVLYLKGAET